MVKSRRASKASRLTTPSQSPPPTHDIVQRLGSRPPSRNPNFQRDREELGKLTTRGSVLDYSNEQSSNTGEDEDGQPATSLISSVSPDPAHISAQPEASALDRATDLKATLSTSSSASDAALLFQRWRISSLKALFTQELKNVLKEAQQDEARLLALQEEMENKEKHLLHALADSAQLRAQLCALENVNGQHQGSSDLEVLQVDLVRALERATSSEAEVERYNKEIGKLRESLKSMEDEASRLDSQLKANVSFLQKEKDGIAKENQVLLEQASVVEEESLPSSLVFSQVLDLLHKLTACLQKNEAHLDFPGAKLSSAVRPNSPQHGGTCAGGAANCKPTPSSRQLVGFTSDSNKKLNKLFTVTCCWKWRWVAAACEVQALSQKLNTVSFQQLASTSCLENMRSCLSQKDLHPSVDLQAPITLEKVFSLFTSIWNVSSQSAHREKEAFSKNRQIEHLHKVMTRWMQRVLKKRRLERVIAHWLRYLLQSWKNKFKHQNVNVLLGMAPTLDTRLRVSKLTAPSQSSCHIGPKHLVDNAVHIKRSTNNAKARDLEIRTRFIKKGPQKPNKDVGAFQDRDLETFQEWLHHRLAALEALIVKEANSWHQEQNGEKLCAHKSSGPSLTRYSAPPTKLILVWKICCAVEHCFFESRNQIISFFGVPSSCVEAEVAASSKLLHSTKKPQANATTRTKGFKRTQT